MENYNSLKTKIRAYFEQGGKLTVLGCFKLFSTNELRHFVAALRKEGIPIKGDWQKTGDKKYKVYYL